MSRHACSVPGCSRPAPYKNPRVCHLHYDRLRNAGALPPRQGAPAGARHGAWRGDEVGYRAAHQRAVWEFRGPARLYACAACGSSRATAWALQPDAVHVLVDELGRRYSPDPSDYRPMCGPCHAMLDARVRDARRNLAMPATELLPTLDDPRLVAPPPAHRTELQPAPTPPTLPTTPPAELLGGGAW